MALSFWPFKNRLTLQPLLQYHHTAAFQWKQVCKIALLYMAYITHYIHCDTQEGYDVWWPEGL